MWALWNKAIAINTWRAKVTQSRKEVGFMWALWYKAIAINTWRAKVANSINQTCPSCGNEERIHVAQILGVLHAQ
jgi:hypothetical protein